MKICLIIPQKKLELSTTHWKQKTFLGFKIRSKRLGGVCLLGLCSACTGTIDPEILAMRLLGSAQSALSVSSTFGFPMVSKTLWLSMERPSPFRRLQETNTMWTPTSRILKEPSNRQRPLIATCSQWCATHSPSPWISSSKTSRLNLKITLELLLKPILMFLKISTLLRRSRPKR